MNPPQDAAPEPRSAVALIALRYDGLSPSHQRVSDFILARPHEAALMTLERLSQATGVSPSTANRLATKLGLSGYPELKDLLRAELQEALRPVEEFVDTVGFSGLSRTAPWTLSMEDDLRRIRNIEAVGGDAAFAQACNLLATARRVHVSGFGGSAFLAGYAVYCLSSLRDGVAALQDEAGFETVGRRLIGATPDDVAVVLGFARYSEQSLRVGRSLRRLKVPTICITDHPNSPLAEFADIRFIAQRRAGFVLSGPGAAALVIIEALLRGAALALGRQAVEERSARLVSLLGDAVVVPRSGE